MDIVKYYSQVSHTFLFSLGKYGYTAVYFVTHCIPKILRKTFYNSTFLTKILNVHTLYNKTFHYLAYHISEPQLLPIVHVSILHPSFSFIHYVSSYSMHFYSSA